MCKGFGYSMTSFPNLFNHKTQKEAASEIHQFWPLVQINCSSVLKFFLCSQYVPVCESKFGHQKLLPCRSVCKKAKKGCLGLMKNYGFRWPTKMRCPKYPRNACLSPDYPSFLKNKTNTKFSGNNANCRIRGGIVKGDVRHQKTKCEKMSIPMCQGLGYNMTSFPSLFNHKTQKEAALEVHQFWPLVQINCSSVLKFFLCSQYAPICESTFVHQKLLPCRSVCEKAKEGCLGLMKNYGFRWPSKMACRKYPRDGCLSPNYPWLFKNGTKTELTANKANCN